MPGLFAEIKEKEDYFHFIACLSSVLLIGCFTEITRGPDSISSDKTIEQTENTGPDSRLYTRAVASLRLVKSMTCMAHCLVDSIGRGSSHNIEVGPWFSKSVPRIM